jgi:cytochrome c oxidase subunit III
MSTASTAHARLQPHHADLGKQTHAARLGMWLFLASEVLLFSGLFALYASYRVGYTDVFRDAVGHTSLPLGTAMTGVLITSSLAVALALHAIRQGRVRGCLTWLYVCIGLGVVFLGLKAMEYREHALEGLLPGIYYDFEDLQERAAIVFYTLYYMMTGLHALHVIAGLVVLGAVAVAVRRRRYDATYHTPVELGALYWHLVDIIWIFLWPIFYLMR